jgi:hypothetical protein
MGKSVARAKPKASAGGRSSGPVVQTRRSAPPTTKAPNRAAANRGLTLKQVGDASAKFNNAVEGAIVAAIPAGRAAKGAKAAASAVKNLPRSVSIAKNTRTLKTATGSKANLARTKIGKAKGLATKSEVKQAKAAVNKKRGMK